MKSTKSRCPLQQLFQFKIDALLLLSFAILGPGTTFPSDGFAFDAGPNDVSVRIIDVGQGHCAVARMPGEKYLIYDAGVGNGDRVFQAISETVRETPQTVVELFVISHTDKDHLAAVPQIMAGLNVRSVLRPDQQPGNQSDIWKNAIEAIESTDCEKLAPGSEFPIGSTRQFGEVVVTMVSGYSIPPADWGLTDAGEIRNAGSIVIRLEYKGKSILFCGDSVGRHRDDSGDACIAAENAMVENAGRVTIKSDVIIAPHAPDACHLPGRPQRDLQTSSCYGRQAIH
jgi:hypothetical protein